MQKEKLSFAEVAAVTFDVGKVNRERCSPIPTDGADAHIDLLANLPYAVAAAIRFNNVTLEAYVDHAKVADVIKTALPKVHWRVNSEQDGEWRFEPGRVELKTVSGKTFRALTKIALGHPDNPMTQAQQQDKFIRQAAMAVNPVSEANARRIIETVAELDSVKDIAQLMQLIS
jgi:2-methylcitrate dehydratase PrpD